VGAHWRIVSTPDHDFILDDAMNQVYLMDRTDRLSAKGLLEKAKRRGAQRRKRPRRPLPGMIPHQDALRHEWLGGRAALDHG
jgi:hypothetical protein